MIYYFCPDVDKPYGGIKKIYAHVDILNRQAISARVLHWQKGFRCTWFEHDTAITALPQAKITAQDFIAVPEFFNLAYMNHRRRDDASKAFRRIFASTAQLVIFNQGTYLTFGGNTFEPGELHNLHTDSRTLAAMTVSEDGENFLRHTFPGLRLFRIHNAIAPDLYRYSAAKKPQICFMPRRNGEHALSVINILKFRGALEGISVVPIENKTAQETAEIMRASLIFLSFGYPEGFSLPPAEAMACGSIVIGYHGMGGREYFKPDICFPIETGDMLTFAATVEDVIRLYRQTPVYLESMARKAAAYIREHYAPGRETEDVLKCWKALLE